MSKLIESDFSLLDTEAKTRIASFIYKLAIRVMKVSKRAIDAAKASAALNQAQSGRVQTLIDFLTPRTALAKQVPPKIQKVLATRTVVPGQGDGIRTDMIFGPLRLLESGGDLGVETKHTEFLPGTPPRKLVALDKLQAQLSSIFGGILPQIKLITSDVRDIADRPFRIDHAYDKQLGAKAWRILHNGGPQDGQVAYYEDPAVLGQMDANPNVELDPWRQAVFSSAEDASLVLNQLTRGTSVKSRNFPKFKEYTVFLKYSAVYLQNDALHAALDSLLSAADAEEESKSQLSAQEKLSLIERSVLWIQERDVSPEALLSTLQAKDPELAKKFKEVLPDVLVKLRESKEHSEASLVEKAINSLRGKNLPSVRGTKPLVWI